MGEVETRKKRTTILAPGFRFHPTDEELVWYYLRRKVSGRRFSLDAISEIDIYKVEPTDLPGLSKLKTRDKEWYFFSALDRKYGNGMRTNRATCDGYWKTTGKDRPVYHDNQVVGMKKTLVYHFGRAPRGKRTDWVMHEYKLVDEQLDKAGYPLEGYVLCRIFRKSGTGPKNGEKYGAPLVEAEWEDNEAENVITSDVSFEDPYADDDAFIEHNDLVKDLDLQFPEGAPLLANVDSQGSHNYVEEHNVIPEGVPLLDNFDSQGRQDYVEECKDVVAPAGVEHGSQAYNDKEISDLYAQANSNADAVKNEYMPQLNGEFNEASVNLSHEPSPNGVVDTDDLFFDPGDFLNLAEENPLDYGCFGSWSDGFIDIEAILKDSPPEPGADIDQAFTFEQDLDDAFFNMPLSSNQLPVSIDAGIGSSSSKTLGRMMDKQSRTALSMPNRWLENIPAHQAFASEMPSKDMASLLSEASSSVQVTAGMVRIRDMSSGLRWSFDKTGSVNVLLSFELPQALGHEELCPSKLPAAVSRGWLCFMFFWVTLFALSIKIGTSIYAK